MLFLQVLHCALLLTTVSWWQPSRSLMHLGLPLLKQFTS